MKLRGIVLLALALGCAPAYAQVTPGVPASSLTINVNHSTGVDVTSCGSVGSPCHTIAYAAGLIQSQQLKSPSGGAIPIIQTDCGFTETVSFLGTGESLNGATKVIGNEGSPGSCVWTSGGNSVSGGAFIIPSGFTFRTTGGGVNFWNVSKMGVLAGFDNICSSAVGGACYYIQTGGMVAFDPGTLQIGDGAACTPNCFNYFVQNNGGVWQPVPNQAITVPNALTYTAFYQGNGTGATTFFNSALTFTGTGSGAGSTGLQYQLTGGALPNFNGTTFPGATAGTVAPPSYVLAQNGQTLVTVSNTTNGGSAQAGYSATGQNGSVELGITSALWGGIAVAVNRAFIYASSGLAGLTLDASGANPIVFASNDLEVGRWDSAVPGKLILGVAGTTVGQTCFGNATSGMECIVPATGALASGVATLPAGTYNIVGDTLAQTLTNKTISGASNTLSVRIASDVTGLGTGIATALGVNTGSAGAPVLFNGAGGTPSSLTLTNATGLPVAGGGTGASTLTLNRLIFGNGTSAVGFVTDGAGQSSLPLVSNGGGSAASFQQITLAAISGFGTGVQTALGNATNGTGGPVTFNGNIGTTATGHASLDLPLTGGTLTGNLAFNPTTAGVTGTTTNDNAATGTAGEFIQSFSRNGSATVTFTSASPTVVTHAGHGMTAAISNCSAVSYTTSSALPTGIIAGTAGPPGQTYFVSIIDANTYHIASSVANCIAGTFVNTSSTGTGTQTALYASGILSSGAATDLGGISLTAGDWDVSATVSYTFASTTVLQVLLAMVANTSVTVPATSQLNSFNFGSTSSLVPNGGFTMNSPTVRVQPTSTTTYFCDGLSTFGTSTATASCFIRARRPR